MCVVEFLIFSTQPKKDLLRVLLTRLVDHDGLKTAGECRVLGKMLLVFTERSRSDNLHLPACKCGLQDICSIKRALRTTGTNERMDLVDEENDVLRLDDLIHDILEPLLELTAILRPRNQCCHRERDDTPILKQERHLTVCDALRQPLGNGRLPNPRLSKKERVVLRTPCEDLDDTVNLLPPPDNRVEVAAASGTRQITAKPFERSGQPLALPLGGLSACRLPLRLLRIAHALEHLALQCLDVNIHLLNRMDCRPVSLRKEAEQDVLCRHKGTLFACGINCPLHDTLGTARVVWNIFGWVQDILKSVRAANYLLRTVIVYAEFIQSLCSNGIAHMQNPQQKLSGSDIPLAAPLRDVL